MSDNGELKEHEIAVMGKLGTPRLVKMSQLEDDELRNIVHNALNKLNVVKAEAETLMNDLFHLRQEAIRRGLYTEEGADDSVSSNDEEPTAGMDWQEAPDLN